MFLRIIAQLAKYIAKIDWYLLNLEQRFSTQITPRPVFITTLSFWVAEEKQFHLVVSLDQF